MLGSGPTVENALSPLPNCAQAVLMCHPSRAAAGALVFLRNLFLATLPQAFVCLHANIKILDLDTCLSDGAREFHGVLFVSGRSLCAVVIDQTTATLPQIRVTQTRPSTMIMIACEYQLMNGPGSTVCRCFSPPSPPALKPFLCATQADPSRAAAGALVFL